jgi:mono/diheme cytochrome c family protein
VFVSLTGCKQPADDDLTKAEPGPVPAAEQRPGDPVAGYDILVNGGYVTCGMPYSAWVRTAQPPDSLPRLPGRRGRNAQLPYYLTAHRNAAGVEIVSANCLLCHGGVFNGELIIGLGNESLDFTEDPRRLVDAIGAYVSGAEETAAWRKWAQRITAIAPYMITDTVGVNPAPNLTLALIAHRDPDTLAWSEQPLLELPPEQPMPASVPPWWRMSKKHAMFYNAMGRGDHARFMMMKSLVCTDDVEEASAIDRDFTNVRAYIASLERPEYPFAVDDALAQDGAEVFQTHCSGCHGSYRATGSYPNLVVDLDAVGTDPAYALQAYEGSDRFVQWFNRSWYGGISEARPARGYIAPPLDGVWATAPYLHNGSVPTIHALLDSSTRPAYWTRSFDSTDYDPDALGWNYRELSQGKAEADDPAIRKRIYDTTLEGYSNAGHTFGDALSESQRRAVIEYLKTL